MFKSFLLLCALIAGSSAWAGDEVYKSLTFPDDDSSNNGLTSNQYASEWTAKSGTFEWTINNFNNNNWNNNWTFIKCGRKNNASIGTIATSTAIDKAITKVVVTIDALAADKVNSIKLYTSSDNSEWVVAGSYTLETGVQTVNLDSPTGNLYYKIVFDCASGASNGLVTVSKVEYYYSNGASTPACATPTFTPAAGAYTSAQSVTIGCETAGATIYYTTDGTAPTTSSSVYSTAIPVSTTTTIKAMAAKAGNSNSDVATATYAILAHAGTEADPYTVADARAAIDANDGLTDVYATGIVSEIVTEYNSDFKNISFNISTDGETTSAQLQAFRCVGIESVTDVSQVQVGDIVVVKGTLTKYNSTYEFKQGNQLISRQSSQKTTPTSVWKSGGNTVTYVKILKGGSISATFETNSNGTKSFESSNAEVATVSNTGVISLTGKAGIAVITASTASNDTYLTSEAKLTIIVGEPVENAVFNFGNYQDYGSGVVPTSENVYVEGVEKTWTAGDVTMKTNGKIRWFIGSNGLDLKLYSKKVDEVETTKIKISAPSGKKLIKFIIKGSNFGNMTADKGTYDSGTWTGSEDDVTLTYGGSNTIGLSTVTVFYTDQEIAVTMGEDGYMTYCNKDVALSFGDLEAFIIPAVGADNVTLSSITQAPYNTPVVLKGTAGSHNLTVLESAEAIETNKLRVSGGSITTTEKDTRYALAKKNGVVGFYKVSAGTMVPEGKCYISVSNTAQVESARDFLGFIEENATRINAVENGQSTGVVFDLQGRQVKQPTKGLYIKNGKKIIIK